MLSVTQPNACVAGFCLCRTLRGDTGDAAHFLLREVDMKKFRFTALLLCLAVLCGALLALAACNDSGSSGQSGSTSGEDPPAEKTVSVADVYDGMGVSMDFDGMLEKEADELADETYGAADVKSYGVEDGKFQVLSMAGDSLSSVVVELPEETLNYLNGDVKENVLDRAQLTADQQVKESERQQIVDRLTSAVEYIESQIGNISNLPASRVNYYAEGETQENVNASTLFSVLGPVLADGSFIRYDVRENGNLFETVIVVPNADGKTEEQIYEAYFSGNYSVGASTEVDLDAEYTPPTPTDPDNPNPGGGEEEETITFDEIYNQVFGEGFVAPSAGEELARLNNLLNNGATNIKLIATNIDSANFAVYSEVVDGLGRTRFMEYVYNGNNETEISDYLTLLQAIENAGGIENYALSIYEDFGDILPGSDNYDELLNRFNELKSYLQGGSPTEELGNEDFTSRTLIIKTNNALPASSNAFGEALMEDMGAEGTIIATYVGDMSGRSLDADDIFNSGYLSGFDITVVYKNGDEISIVTTECLVPWYTNSTNQSQYEEFVKQNGNYRLRNTQTTTIENPTATATASSEAALVM